MLPGKLLGMVSGKIVEVTGFGVYFWITALVAIPAIVLFFWLKPRLSLGEDDDVAVAREAAKEPAG